MTSISNLFLLHLCITVAYWSTLWSVQLLSYPQFFRVSRSDFSLYHREHCRRMGWIVAPLFVLEGLTALLLAYSTWSAQPFLNVASLVLFALGHGATFVFFVPLHTRLSRSLEVQQNLRRAVNWNWLRVALSTLRVAVLAMIAGDCW